MLHVCVLVSAGHATPPLAADMLTVRACVCDPEPHETEQDPNVPQSETTQSTGHDCVLHACVLVSAGQAVPPGGLVVIVLDAVCTPIPQEAEQDPNEPHDPTTQSTGHGRVLHCSVMLSSRQAAPPLAAGMLTVRV